jgi:hypothetical protein
MRRCYAAFLLLFVACSTPKTTDVPSEAPSIRGTITSRTQTAILVEEDPAQRSGSAKASAQLNAKTTVSRADGRSAGQDDLKPGQVVSVWFTGPVAQSYPVRGTAARIVIEREAAATSPSTSAGQVTLKADMQGAGRVLLRLTNGSRDAVGYNLCSSSLQRRSGSTWQTQPTGEMCTMELRTLQPGASATFEKTLPTDIAPGDYRYVTRVEGAAEVASNVFTIN